MNKNVKIILVLLSASAIVLLCFSSTLFVMNNMEREKKESLQKSLDQVMSDKQVLEARLKEIEIANAELKGNVKSQEDRIGMLTQRMAEEKDSYNKTLAKIQEKEAEIDKLKARIDEEKQEKEDALKRLEKLNEDYIGIKFQLESLMKTKEEMEKKAKELAEKEGVSLGTIVIRQGSK